MATSEAGPSGYPDLVAVLRADETLVHGALFVSLFLPVLFLSLPTLLVTVLAGAAAGGIVTVSLGGFARLYFDPVPRPGDLE
jgi:hypothetical protein